MCVCPPSNSNTSQFYRLPVATTTTTTPSTSSQLLDRSLAILDEAKFAPDETIFPTLARSFRALHTYTQLQLYKHLQSSNKSSPKVIFSRRATFLNHSHTAIKMTSSNSKIDSLSLNPGKLFECAHPFPNAACKPILSRLRGETRRSTSYSFISASS